MVEILPEDREEFHKLGDINWDGVIDIADGNLLKAAFGSSVGTRNWNPDCDLNADGVVNMVDVGLLNKSFGMTIEQYVLIKHPPPPEIYTFRLTFRVLPWFSKSGFEGIINTAVVSPVASAVSLLGYTFSDAKVVYRESTVDVDINFVKVGSPVAPVVVWGVILVGVLLGAGLILVGIAWIYHEKVEEEKTLAKKETEERLGEELEAGLITSEQYTALMTKLEEVEDEDMWGTITKMLPLVLGLVVVGAVVGIMPRRRD